MSIFCIEVSQTKLSRFESKNTAFSTRQWLRQLGRLSCARSGNKMRSSNSVPVVFVWTFCWRSIWHKEWVRTQWSCAPQYIYVVPGTNKKVKCTSTSPDWTEARDRLTYGRPSVTQFRHWLHCLLFEWLPRSDSINGKKTIRRINQRRYQQTVNKIQPIHRFRHPQKWTVIEKSVY